MKDFLIHLFSDQLFFFFQNYKKEFLKNNKTSFNISTGSTAKLFAQIFNKAPVDIFLSADQLTIKKIPDNKKIKLDAKKIGANIITTEKDYVKLAEEDKKEIKYLEVSLELKCEKRLIEFIKKSYEKY